MATGVYYNTSVQTATAPAPSLTENNVTTTATVTLTTGLSAITVPMPASVIAGSTGSTDSSISSEVVSFSSGSQTVTYKFTATNGAPITENISFYGGAQGTLV